MKSIADYQRHAEECEALARSAVTDEQRVMIAKMAATWRMLARQRERHLTAKATVDAVSVVTTRKPEDQ
jgi:hypothetical protein